MLHWFNCQGLELGNLSGSGQSHQQLDERRNPGMNVRTVSIRQSRRFLGLASSRSAPRVLGILQQGFHICSCSQRICLGRGMAWDGPGCATGLWHAPAWWQGGVAGVPGVLQRLLPPLAALDEQAASITCPRGSSQGAEGVEAVAWGQRAKPGGHGTFPKVPALFPCPRTTLCAGCGIISTRREHLLQSGSEQSSQALISLQIVLWRLLLLSSRDLGCLKLAVAARGCPWHPHLLPGALGAGLSLPG